VGYSITIKRMETDYPDPSPFDNYPFSTFPSGYNRDSLLPGPNWTGDSYILETRSGLFFT